MIREIFKGLDVETSSGHISRDMYIFLFQHLVKKWYINLPLCALILVFTSSCNNEEIRNLSSANKFSGKELVRGIVLFDGKVASKVSLIRNHFNLENFIENKKDLQVIRDIQEKLLNKVDKEYPKLFKKFHHIVYSEDPYLIEKEINRVHEIIYDASMELDEVKLYVKFMENPNIREFIKNKMNDVKSESVIKKIQELANDENFIQLIEREYQSDNELTHLDLSGRKQCAAVAIVLVGAVGVVLYGAVGVAVYAWVGLWGPDIDHASTSGVQVPTDENPGDLIYRDKYIESIVKDLQG